MQNLKRLECDILEAVYDKGFVLPNSPASKVLSEKYPSEHEQQVVTVTLLYLLEERYLWPFFNHEGREKSAGHARGITPKGIDRLRKLQHPWWHWISKNWFPVLVTAISAGIGITNIFVNQ